VVNAARCLQETAEEEENSRVQQPYQHNKRANALPRHLRLKNYRTAYVTYNCIWSLWKLQWQLQLTLATNIMYTFLSLTLQPAHPVQSVRILHVAPSNNTALPLCTASLGCLASLTLQGPQKHSVTQNISSQVNCKTIDTHVTTEHAPHLLPAPSCPGPSP
jgi:hypothetical protein